MENFNFSLLGLVIFAAASIAFLVDIILDLVGKAIARRRP